ncbi:hypothetical protein GCM10029964_082640 [Kibdelosporangium lantanae]
MSISLANLPDVSDVLALDGPLALVDVIVPMLSRPAGEIDRQLGGAPCEHLLDAVRELNRGRAEGRRDAFYAQQLLLSKIYELGMSLRDTPSAEGSVVLYRVTRLLEDATIAAEDAGVDQDLLSAAPEAEYVSWIKTIARAHRAFKHPYYTEFIRDQAGKLDLRNYVIQESVVDARFDDLLAMTQIGTDGAAKMEIARNFWDEMGNGDPAEVHTRLFNQIFDVLAITPEELAAGLSAEALLSGNLAVLTSRYRALYPESIGYLGVTEWLVPDRFVNVVHAWERLGLPEVGITYHRLHITVDARHAAGWFHNVIGPAARSAARRRGITRGILWRLNSSARYLDERLGKPTVQRSR